MAKNLYKYGNPIPNSYGTECSADQLQKTGEGFIHSLIVDCTVAGTFVLRDAVSAGTGTVIKTFNFTTGCYTIILDVAFSTGLYCDFGTATATVNVSYV